MINMNSTALTNESYEQTKTEQWRKAGEVYQVQDDIT